MSRPIKALRMTGPRQERFSAVDLDPVGPTPDELSALIRKETVMYANLVKQIDFKPQ